MGALARTWWPCRKVYYYDAIHPQNRGEDETAYAVRVAPKRSELAGIERQPGYHVRTGETRHRARRGNEQKMVDVQLAVDALQMASRNLFGSCILLTGDLDFKPLVTALVEMGVDVQLLYPVGETDDDLIAAADSAKGLTINLMKDWFNDSKKALLPIATSHLLAQPLFHRNKVNTWNDDNYDLCYVAKDSDKFELLTERSSGKHRT